jgi:Replication initiation factor
MTSIELLRSGIDWLSGTMPLDAEGIVLWELTCVEVLQKLEKEGHILKARNLLGYQGYSCGNNFWGTRHDGEYLQLTSETADRFYEQVFTGEFRPTRVDYQTTVTYVNEDLTIAKEVYDAFSRNVDSSVVTTTKKGLLISGTDGGDTVYLGAPSAVQRGRIYNKDKQSGSFDYKRAWRYEVCFRDVLARKLSERCPKPRGIRADYVSAVVRKWFAGRSTPERFLWGADDLVLPKIKTIPTDIERRLAWLDRQVLPTLKYLHEHGYDANILLLVERAGVTTQP